MKDLSSTAIIRPLYFAELTQEEQDDFFRVLSASCSNDGSELPSDQWKSPHDLADASTYGLYVEESSTETLVGGLVLDGHDSRVLWIEYLAVDVDYRGQQIGRAAILFSEEYARSNNSEAVRLNAAPNPRTLNFHKRTIELIDTAGIRRQGKIERGIEKFSVLRSLQAIEEADVCLLLMDATELNTSLDQRLAGMIDEAGKGMVIVVSKWDLVDKTDKTRDILAGQISYHFKFTPWAPLAFTSSITGQNVSKLYEIVTDIDARRHQDTKTRVLNDLLQKAIVKHPPAGLKNTHPKLRYIVQTDTSPPWFVIYGSNLKFVHWSYKRYLERLVREAYDYSGTPIKFSFRDEKQINRNKPSDN